MDVDEETAAMDDLPGAEDEIDPEESPSTSRLPLASTVTLRTIPQAARSRKKPGESTWVKEYYEIIQLSTTWVNHKIAGKPTLFDREWRCKYCRGSNIFKSLDSVRRGPTS